MENTTQNRLRFFAQYWEQDDIAVNLHSYNIKHINHHTIADTLCLQLTDLKDISDEDAIELYIMLYGKKNIDNVFNMLSKEKAIYEIKLSVFSTKNHLKYDFLRSKGYLIPYNGLSTEQILEYGWAQLKQPKQ